MYSYDRRVANQVAKTIVDQMGGMGRLRMMINADIRAIPNGVWIRFPNRSRSKPNLVIVKLQADDTYEMKFYRDGGALSAEQKLIKEYNRVYNDDLVRIFETITGLYLRI